MKKLNGVYVGWCVISPRNYKDDNKFKDLINYMNDNSDGNWSGCDDGDYYGFSESGNDESRCSLSSCDWELYSIEDAWDIIFNENKSMVDTVKLVSTQKPLI